MLRSMCLVALVAVADGLRAGAPLGRRAAVTGAVGALVSWRAPAEAKELSPLLCKTQTAWRLKC